MTKSSRAVFMLSIIAALLQLSPQAALAQTCADLNLPARQSSVDDFCTAKSIPQSTWKPPSRCEVVDVPEAKVTCQLVARGEKIDTSKANATISQLEQTVFRKTFKRKSIEDRLNNLELNLFGWGRLGDFNSRIKAVRNAISPCEPAIESPVIDTNAVSAAADAWDDLAALESRFYENEDFSLQAPEERLLRLELLVFGHAKEGNPHARLLALQNAVDEKDNAIAEAAELANRRRAAELNSESIKSRMEDGIQMFEPRSAQSVDSQTKLQQAKSLIRARTQNSITAQL